MTELQIEATSALLMRPSGDHLIAFIAENPAFEGVGQVKARKLWNAFGEHLYELLDQGDSQALVGVLSFDSAVQVVQAWSTFGNTQTLQWLQSQGFTQALARKVVRFFGDEAPAKIEEDPYRLLSFCATWRQVDELARVHFDVAIDDPRRLQGAIEESCYRIFSSGHTTAQQSRMMAHIQGVLGPQTKAWHWRNLVTEVLSRGFDAGSCIVGPQGIQPIGAHVMEREVADAVARRLELSSVPLAADNVIDELLSAYEQQEGIQLNPEQRSAIHLALKKSVLLITGGAGVGKTTVLKALYGAYDRVGINVVQLALAGRAAKRMQEATDRPAMTIANFLRVTREGAYDERTAVVVDEVSMVDIITMSRLCELLGPSPRLVLVGDPAQLMPVGPGLVLHALIEVPQVPVVQLKTVKRYGGDIAAAASAIRNGVWPTLRSDSSAPISFLPCAPALDDGDALPRMVLQLYRESPSNTQILCGRRGGLDGSMSFPFFPGHAVKFFAASHSSWG